MRHSAIKPPIIIKSSKVRDEEIKRRTNRENPRSTHIRYRQTQLRIRTHLHFNREKNHKSRNVLLRQKFAASE